jgi:hypothetical protein
VASNNKKVTTSDYSYEDDNEASSFSRILVKTKPETSTKSKNKPETNSEQTENKLSTQPRTELRTNAEQTENNGESLDPKTEQTENKLSTQPRTELRTNTEQTENKLGTISSFSQLVGLQRKIIEIVYDFCRSSGEKNTDRLSLQFLAHACNSSPAVVQVTTRRLIIKGVLLKFDSKEGRGGWTRYALPDAVYREIFQLETQNKLRTNTEQMENKLSTQPRTQPRTSPPSSSRDFYLNDSTTTQNVDNSEPDAGALKSLDFSIVTEFGITSSTLSRCRELYPSVSNDQLIALTERFGKFMKTQDAKRVQNARGFFISLAEQLSKGVTPLDHIETREQALMREFVERAKEAKVRRELLEKEALEFAFEEWTENLDSKKRDELVPPNSVIESGSKIQTMQLKEYFRSNVWPTRFAVSKEAPGAEA